MIRFPKISFLIFYESHRLFRVYHSQQIEQNGTISCLCSHFHNRITKKVSFTHKMKENVTENFDVHRNTTRKMNSKIFKMVHDSIIFSWWAFFLFEINIFNNFRGKSPKSRKKTDLILGGSRISVWEQQIFAIFVSDTTVCNRMKRYNLFNVFTEISLVLILFC